MRSMPHISSSGPSGKSWRLVLGGGSFIYLGIGPYCWQSAINFCVIKMFHVRTRESNYSLWGMGTPICRSSGLDKNVNKAMKWSRLILRETGLSSFCCGIFLKHQLHWPKHRRNILSVATQSVKIKMRLWMYMSCFFFLGTSISQCFPRFQIFLILDGRLGLGLAIFNPIIKGPSVYLNVVV